MLALRRFGSLDRPSPGSRCSGYSPGDVMLQWALIRAEDSTVIISSFRPIMLVKTGSPVKPSHSGSSFVRVVFRWRVALAAGVPQKI